MWDIPDEATVPPCTRHYATEVMRRLNVLNSGINIKFFPSTEPEKLKRVMFYLEECGFISADDNAGDTYPLVTVLGNTLIKEDDDANKKYDKQTKTKGFKVGSDGISASYEVKEEKDS